MNNADVPAGFTREEELFMRILQGVLANPANPPNQPWNTIYTARLVFQEAKSQWKEIFP